MYAALIYDQNHYIPLVDSAHSSLFQTLDRANQWHRNHLNQPLPQIIQIEPTDREYF